MNKRLQELAEEAWNATAVSPDFGHPVSFAEKLSELLIQECKQVIRQEWYDANNTEPEQDARSIAIHVGKKAGINCALNAVSQHFKN